MPFNQNINYAQLVGILAMILVFATGGKINLSLSDQAELVGTIQILISIYTVLVHTFINHPANKAAASVMVTNAVARAKGIAPLLMVFCLLGTIGLVLSGCASFFDNPQNDLTIAETGFNTALALYNSVCMQNPTVSVCSAADVQEATSLVSAVNAAIQAAQTLLGAEQTASGGSAPTSAQIQSSIAAVTSAVTQYNNFVNSLQTKQQAAMLLRAHQ